VARLSREPTHPSSRRKEKLGEISPIIQAFCLLRHFRPNNGDYMSLAALVEKPSNVAPFALKDAPSFIERQFPVGRLSAEAFKERDAKQAQTLTALGSYRSRCPSAPG
jgi:hypothetical protein